MSGFAEAAEFFFVAADGFGDGLQCDAEVSDFSGEACQGVCFPAAGAVFLDDAAQVGVAVEGGPPESGALGDLIEGDGLPAKNDCSADVFDVLAALFARHPV